MIFYFLFDLLFTFHIAFTFLCFCILIFSAFTIPFILLVYFTSNALVHFTCKYNNMYAFSSLWFLFVSFLFIRCSFSSVHFAFDLFFISIHMFSLFSLLYFLFFIPILFLFLPQFISIFNNFVYCYFNFTDTSNFKLAMKGIRENCNFSLIYLFNSLP